MKSIGLVGSAVASGRQPEAEVDVALFYSAVDYYHLAEECYFLAAIEGDPAVAAELVNAGDAYLRCVVA